MAEGRLQRRLSAILVADVVGFSRMMGEDEAGTLARVTAVIEDILEAKLEQHAGRLVKTMGDGVLAEFSSAVDAVNFAVEVQRSMAERSTGSDDARPIALRIGINVGDVIVLNNDIFGDGVNVASRLEPLAAAGGICVSGTVFDQVRGKLELSFRAMGEQALKNIAEPVRAFAIDLNTPPGQRRESAPAEKLFSRPAFAVLPFENNSSDQEDAYFADGLTEDIITALSLWRAFPVIARNSTLAYKGVSPDIRAVGKELGARYILQGSVRRAGSRLRVTAQLSNAANGHQVWAERFDRNVSDIFDLQDELTQRIAATVVPELEQAERTRAAPQAPEDLDAWA